MNPVVCFDAPPPADYRWTGFQVTTVWEGFFLAEGATSLPGLYPYFGACWIGPYPFVSGATYEVWALVPVGTEATAPLTIGYFPDLASPEYRFTFR